MADTKTNIIGKDVKLVDNGDGTTSLAVSNEGMDSISEVLGDVHDDDNDLLRTSSIIKDEEGNKAKISKDGSINTSTTDIVSGIATDGTQTTLVDANKDFTVNMLKNAIIEIDIGIKKYFRKITSNTATTITFPALEGASASAVIGSAEAGQVTVVCDTQGIAGNEYSIEFVKASGQNMTLSSSLTDLVITVYLGTDENGDLDPAKNTATAIAESISQINGFTATMTGSGGAMTETAEPVEFTGGIAIVSATAGIGYKIKSDKLVFGSKSDSRATDEDASELSVISLLRAIMGYLKTMSGT